MAMQTIQRWVIPPNETAILPCLCLSNEATSSMMHPPSSMLHPPMQATGQSRGATPRQPQSTSPFPKPPLNATEAARMGTALTRRGHSSANLGAMTHGANPSNPFKSVLDGAFVNPRLPAASGGVRDA